MPSLVLAAVLLILFHINGSKVGAEKKARQR